MDIPKKPAFTSQPTHSVGEGKPTLPPTTRLMGKRRAVSPEESAKGKQLCRRRSNATVLAHTVFTLTDIFLGHLLYQCDLATIFLLAHSCQWARDQVKTFFRTNLRALLVFFVSELYIDKFYETLLLTLGGVAGSVASAALTYPYRHNWRPADLNIYVPFGNPHGWRDFFLVGNFAPAAVQPGVERRYSHAVHSHVVYESKKLGFTIALTESVDASILTPLAGTTSTFATNLFTSHDILSLYPYLLRRSRALEGWFPTPVMKAVAMGRRGIRSSFSTASWEVPCGWNCPVMFRYVRDSKGIGLFRWGGSENKFKDGSDDGLPFTDNNVKWCLGDTCTNRKCKKIKANYYDNLRNP
ncbi:hypothetical protein C8R47DRAFT_1220164 [Mycena vitilis]|nr:hypothetical protein C8R47DRAFT_1220164 [Mycena vitilis]